MTKEEFINVVSQCGYASKKYAKNYIKNHAKDNYTDDDIIECHRDEQRVDVVTASNMHLHCDRNGNRIRTTKNFDFYNDGRLDSIK